MAKAEDDARNEGTLMRGDVADRLEVAKCIPVLSAAKLRNVPGLSDPHQDMAECTSFLSKMIQED